MWCLDATRYIRVTKALPSLITSWSSSLTRGQGKHKWCSYWSWCFTTKTFSMRSQTNQVTDWRTELIQCKTLVIIIVVDSNIIIFSYPPQFYFHGEECCIGYAHNHSVWLLIRTGWTHVLGPKCYLKYTTNG